MGSRSFTSAGAPEEHRNASSPARTAVRRALSPTTPAWSIPAPGRCGRSAVCGRRRAAPSRRSSHAPGHLMSTACWVASGLRTPARRIGMRTGEETRTARSRNPPPTRLLQMRSKTACRRSVSWRSFLAQLLGAAKRGCRPNRKVRPSDDVSSRRLKEEFPAIAAFRILRQS
jgi:hypothetical protein